MPGVSTVYGLDQTQAAAYRDDNNSRKMLHYYLASYLSLPSSASIGTTTSYLARVFLCPAWDASMPGSSPTAYSPRSDLVGYAFAFAYSTLRNETNSEWQIDFLPFGKQSTQEQPKKIGAIPNPSSIPVIADFDALAVGSTGGLGQLYGRNKSDGVALKPVYE